MEKYIVSIEISSSRVVLLLATAHEKGKYGLSILHNETQRLPQGSLSRGRIVNKDQVKRVVQNLLMNKNVSKHQGNIYYCISVNGLDFHCTSRSTSLNGENMTVYQNDLQSLRALMETAKVADEDEMLSNLELRQYVIDDLLPTISPIGTSCNKIEATYLLTITKKSLSVSYADMVGTTASNVQIYPIASSKGLILLSPEDKQNGVALIDFGSQTTSVAVYYKDRLQGEFSLPIGSDLITSDMMKALDLTDSQAESLKRAFGIENNDETDYQMFLPTFSDGQKAKRAFLLNDLKFYAKARVEEIVDYVIGGINQKNDLRDRAKKYVITGGGAKLKGLDKLIEKRTNRPVEIITDDEENSAESLQPKTNLICAIGMASRFSRENADKFVVSACGQNIDTNPREIFTVPHEETPASNATDRNRGKGKKRNPIFDAVGSIFEKMTDESNQGAKL